MKKFLPSSLPFGVNCFKPKRLALSERSESKGFTLVELLVVITILAILSVVGITIFGGVQKNARDAKRRNDVDAISKALETHYNDVSDPCVATTAMPYCASVAASFFAGNTVPSDPAGPGGVIYVITIPAARTTYTVCASLENANGNSSSAGDGTTFAAASGTSAAYYCKRSQQ